MVAVTTAQGSFHAQVIAARLGAEGIVTELRGAVGGIYPVPGEVEVLVPDDDLPVAAELLLADEVEAIFDGVEVRPPLLRRVPLLVYVGLLAVVAWTIAATARGF
jgi:hypothetical protein